MMQVTVMVADNNPPTVNAGPDQTVDEGGHGDPLRHRLGF